MLKSKQDKTPYC